MSSIESMKDVEKNEPNIKIADGILFLSKRIQFLKHELWQREEQLEEQQDHISKLETELKLNQKKCSNSENEVILKIKKENTELKRQSESKDKEMIKIKEENKKLRRQCDSKDKEMIQLKQKEDKIEQLQKHILWLETESQ